MILSQNSVHFVDDEVKKNLFVQQVLDIIDKQPGNLENCVKKLKKPFLNYATASDMKAAELAAAADRIAQAKKKAHSKSRSLLIDTLNNQAYAAAVAQEKAEREAQARDQDEFDAAEAVEEAEAQARAEARALGRAAASLKRTQRSSIPVSATATASVLGIDFQNLTMEEIVDQTLVEFCALYKFLEQGQYKKSQIMIQLKENLMKQILVLKTKNDHDHQSNIIS